MRYRLPLAVSGMTEAAIAAVNNVLRSGQLTMGERTRLLENEIARQYGIAGAVMVNSGSSANLLALTAAGIGPGDEVIVPALTWPTQIWPIIQLGATPVLVDVDPANLAIRYEAVAPAMTARTKAVFVAHLLGNPAPLEEIRPLCHDRVDLLEDACEAMDADCHGHPAGTWGRMGTLSFYFSHQFSTVEGGMILVRSDCEALSRLRSLRSHGMTRDMDPVERNRVQEANPGIDPRFLFAHRGYNLRPTEIQAAIGVTQMGSRITWRDVRRRIAAVWQAAVCDRPDLFRPFIFSRQANPFAFPLMLSIQAPFGKRVLISKLEAHGIETRPILAGDLTTQPAMTKGLYRVSGDLEGTRYLDSHGIYIGLHHTMTQEDVSWVAGIIRGMQ